MNRMKRKRVQIVGVPFDNLSRKAFLRELLRRMREKQKTFLVTANPEIVMYAQEDQEYMQLLHDADFVAPDGIGIVRAARKLNMPIKERVPGFELMIGLLELANLYKKRVYFIGAQEEVVEKAVENVKQRWPDVEIAGYHNGYFNHSSPEKIQMVQATKPDIVLVAFGFPRQEKWIKHYLSTADSGIAIGVGGSFDVLSGKAKRAPNWAQKLHVEWLYRLAKQPSRYRRMLALPAFMREVCKQKKRERADE